MSLIKAYSEFNVHVLSPPGPAGPWHTTFGLNLIRTAPCQAKDKIMPSCGMPEV